MPSIETMMQLCNISDLGHSTPSNPQKPYLTKTYACVWFTQLYDWGMSTHKTHYSILHRTSKPSLDTHHISS